MTHDPLCKGGDCTCTCDQLQEGHRRGCPGEDCDCLFIAEIRADEAPKAVTRWIEQGASSDDWMKVWQVRDYAEELEAKVRADQDKKYINPNCMWGEAECIPDCPSCRRLDELYLQRSIGYAEGYNAFNKPKECTHQNSLDIWRDAIPYCSKCGQDTSYLYEMGN